uniref:Protein kinase n=1 Tax=Medicago truncatula TaxID=3880 RepID=A2Q1Q1_MEDTR|nr:Protein kinase [Medicago truncatula]
MSLEGTIIAVKKSKQLDRNQIEAFVKVFILSQINSMNYFETYPSEITVYRVFAFILW